MSRTSYLAKVLLIKEGESSPVLHFWFIFMVLLGTGLAIGRASADALFLKRYGIEYLPVMYIILAFTLAGISTVYASLADQIPSERFFRIIITTLLVTVISGWVVMTRFSTSAIYPAYYLIYKISSELLLLHGTLYMTQNFNTLQAKRLSPIIFAGEEVGTLFGGLLVTALTPILGVENLLLVWVALLLTGLAKLFHWHYTRGSSPYYRPVRKSASVLRSSVRSIEQGLKFARGSRMVKLTSLSLFFLVIAFYILRYTANRIYTSHFTDEADLAVFFGGLTVATSGLALVLQLLITNRVIERFGLRRTNIIFPVSAGISFVLLLFRFALPSAVLASINLDALLKAFHTPIRSMFFNILPAYIQGRARAMSLAVVMPVALLACGILLWLTQHFDNPVYFLVPGFLAALAYLYCNYRMNQAYGQTLIHHMREQLELPQQHALKDMEAPDEATFTSLSRALQTDDDTSLTAAKLLTRFYPDRAAEIIFPRMRQAGSKYTDLLAQEFAVNPPTGLADLFCDRYADGDNHLRATILKTMKALGDLRAIQMAETAIEETSPRVRAAAVPVLLNQAEPVIHQRAMSVWRELCSREDIQAICAVELLPVWTRLPESENHRLQPALQQAIATCLTSGRDPLVARTLYFLSNWSASLPNGLVEQSLQRMQQSTCEYHRTSALFSLHLAKEGMRTALLKQALNDGHKKVRQQAVSALRSEQADFSVTLLKWINLTSSDTPRIRKTLIEAGRNDLLPNAQMLKIAETSIQQAMVLHQAWQLVRAQDLSERPGLRLLGTTLYERFNQTLDLVLAALEPLCPKGITALVGSALRSGDTSIRANACEALNLMEDLPLAKTLSLIIQGDAELIARSTQRDFGDLDKLLYWARQCDDHWLRTIAELVETGTLGDKTLQDLLERVSLLKNSSVFSEVASDDLLFVAQALQEVPFFAGDRVFDIFDQGEHFYLIEEGKVGISLARDVSSREFIVTLTAGDCFGEMNLLDDLPRSATAHVLTDSRMLALEKCRLRELILSYPEISLGMLRSLSLKVRENHQRVSELEKQLGQQ